MADERVERGVVRELPVLVGGLGDGQPVPPGTWYDHQLIASRDLPTYATDEEPRPPSTYRWRKMGVGRKFALAYLAEEGMSEAEHMEDAWGKLLALALRSPE